MSRRVKMRFALVVGLGFAPGFPSYADGFHDARPVVASCQASAWGRAPDRGGISDYCPVVDDLDPLPHIIPNPEPESATGTAPSASNAVFLAPQSGNAEGSGFRWIFLRFSSWISQR